MGVLGGGGAPGLPAKAGLEVLHLFVILAGIESVHLSHDHVVLFRSFPFFCFD